MTSTIATSLNGSQQLKLANQVDFQEINDNDISEITNYYYTKYKKNKRRQSSLTRELKKIEKIEGDMGSEKTSSVYDPSRHELNKKREEILQKFT